MFVRLFVCLFCDFYRKDSEDFKIKNAHTKKHLSTTIFNWSKNVVYVFKDAKRFVTLMNSSKLLKTCIHKICNCDKNL